LDTGKAGIIAAIEPLVGALLGMTVYNEPRTPLKIAGIVLIFASIILLNLPSKAETKTDN
ncbi:MAG: EamA family transporter, partial [Clostridia bacterium]|nr:EamA family transporter [Clostridia bacterium]